VLKFRQIGGSVNVRRAVVSRLHSR
jgi:hypothetical protein